MGTLQEITDPTVDPLGPVAPPGMRIPTRGRGETDGPFQIQLWTMLYWLTTASVLLAAVRYLGLVNLPMGNAYPVLSLAIVGFLVIRHIKNQPQQATSEK